MRIKGTNQTWVDVDDEGYFLLSQAGEVTKTLTLSPAQAQTLAAYIAENLSSANIQWDQGREDS